MNRDLRVECLTLMKYFEGMAFLRILFVCALAVGLSNCRKKSDAVGKEVREAGYEMTAEGWFRAVKGNDVAVLRKMAEGGFDIKIADPEGNGAMHVAAAGGAKEAAEFLLNKGFAVDAKGAKGRTPLMAAVIADRPEMVQWLIKQGADPKVKDEDGFMALMLAVSGGGKGSVAELAPYHRDDLDSALLLASLVGKAEIIDELTNYGASVYARMEDGRTPLMLAAQNGHKEAAAMLIDIGASRFATIESGDTAQSLAVAAGHAELAELIEKGFPGDVLALESDGEIAAQMGDYLDENQAAPEEPVDGGARSGEGDGAEQAGEDPVVANDPEQAGDVPWNRPIAGQGAGSFGALPENPGASARAAKDSQTSGQPPAPLAGASIGKLKAEGRVNAPDEETDADLPLVMRHYRQRELPVEVKKVSGGVASLHLAGGQGKEVQVAPGETIPGSNLVVVRVYSRMESGKLNDGESFEVGVVEVEDKGSGLKREWLEGRPAAGHDPVALVEDAATGQRYVAKPGQRFRSEDGREFIVNDVRPSQLVIEDAGSGEVRTLRLRGPRG
jgi:ankyrin repeat protein